MRNIRTVLLLLTCGLMLSATEISFAQSYPSKPVRLIIPFAPGSGTDIIARVVSQKLAEALGQQIVVDNRPGANGIIAADGAAKAAPDGYTLFMGTSSTQGVNVSLFDKLPYDLTAGVDMTIVPYKAPSTAFIDLAGGQVDALFGDTASSLPQIKGGRLKALGVASARRSALLPEVPTIAESGYPGFEAGAWVGLFAPSGTPKEIIAKLQAEVVKVLQTSDVKEKLLQNGTEVIGGTSEQLAEAVKAEIAKWSRVVKATNFPKAN